MSATALSEILKSDDLDMDEKDILAAVREWATVNSVRLLRFFWTTQVHFVLEKPRLSGKGMYNHILWHDKLWTNYSYFILSSYRGKYIHLTRSFKRRCFSCWRENTYPLQIFVTYRSSHLPVRLWPTSLFMSLPNLLFHSFVCRCCLRKS